MINLKDYILKDNKKGEIRRLYKCSCDECGRDRGYKRNSKINEKSLCRSCSQSGINDQQNFPNVDFLDFKQNTRSKSYRTTCMSCAKDKGYVRKKDILRPCLSCAAKNRNSDMHPEIREKAKIKISCTQRNIKIEDFREFSTSIDEIERNKFKSSNLRDNCFKNAYYTCDLYNIKGIELNAHHLDSWHNNEDKRFALENLICLSKDAHSTFHKRYGRKNNTKEQYEEFKKETKERLKIKQDLYIVAGCPASGKSWVCNQLKDKFNYIPYDNTPKTQCIQELIMNNDKPLLFDPTIKVSTFTKRVKDMFNIKLIVIVENEETINERMINRGGEITPTIKKRIKRMSNLSKNCEFSGTSSEVLSYLKLLF